jgi:hypothetical protein
MDKVHRACASNTARVAEYFGHTDTGLIPNELLCKRYKRTKKKTHCEPRSAFAPSAHISFGKKTTMNPLDMHGQPSI